MLPDGVGYLDWRNKPYVKEWLRQNPTVRKWLDNSDRLDTQRSHGSYLYKFCRGIGETPEELRRTVQHRQTGSGRVPQEAPDT